MTFCASGFVADSLRDKGFSVYKMPKTTFLGLPKFISNKLLKNSQNRTPPVKEGKTIGSIWMVYRVLRKKYFLKNIILRPILILKRLLSAKFNAEMVQNQGAGYFGELSNFNTEWIADKICNTVLFKSIILQTK